MTCRFDENETVFTFQTPTVMQLEDFSSSTTSGPGEYHRGALSVPLI